GAGRADIRQCRGGDASLAAVHRGSLRVIAAARALPVQARRLSRRDLALVRFGRLAAGKSPLALSVDRTAAASPGCRRLARQCHSHSVRGLLGIAVLLLFAWLLSEDRFRVAWRGRRDGRAIAIRP